MPTTLTTPLTLLIPAEPLTRGSFSPFGDVIENPHPDIRPSTSLPSNLYHQAVSANQGTAIKYQNVSTPLDLYSQAPSKSSKPIVSIFSCAARALEPASPPPAPPISTLLPYTYAGPSRGGRFRVTILERHPFTTQTFVPFAAAGNVAGAGYLVIVAPTLPESSVTQALPAPQAGGRGRGLPDLKGLKAFVASPGQAVTYGAGTWHAPMVALGPQGTAIDFVVNQFASGVGVEDCQEVIFEAAGDGAGIVVQVPERMPVVAKL
ncbi:ureidoglycolate hydrolase [Colletotrichum truncatum]|uniref:Ureidoglycolate hydrolase n=1 Tax=Colletotrichum truncatum TaxID=5467 RepID=A0ACC3ZDW1_COLTU|nr:ureidoglycolate hydrolase [Colletotrichum truncatum]KAF6794835.1 ureidoglycolate hydrolase [Colletotrichum truncatum]